MILFNVQVLHLNYLIFYIVIFFQNNLKKKKNGSIDRLLLILSDGMVTVYETCHLLQCVKVVQTNNLIEINPVYECR